MFDVALAGLDRVLLASELMVQVEGIRGRSGSLADVLPSAADVPEELDFYGEQRPDGTFDAEENRSEDADSWWVNPMNIVGMSI